MSTSIKCPTCQHESHHPEINDDPLLDGKIRVEEVVMIHNRPFRVMRLNHMTLTLEKL